MSWENRTLELGMYQDRPPGLLRAGWQWEGKLVIDVPQFLLASLSIPERMVPIADLGSTLRFPKMG